MHEIKHWDPIKDKITAYIFLYQLQYNHHDFQCCFKIVHVLQVTRVQIYPTKSYPVCYKFVIGLHFLLISVFLF